MQQRDVFRAGVDMQFVPLTTAGDGRPVVVGGPWSGEAWPERMLVDAVDGWLRGTRCPVIAPAAQVEIKQMMPVWVPGQPRRANDSADIDRLLKAMQIRRSQQT